MCLGVCVCVCLGVSVWVCLCVSEEAPTHHAQSLAQSLAQSHTHFLSLSFDSKHKKCLDTEPTAVRAAAIAFGRT